MPGANFDVRDFAAAQHSKGVDGDAQLSGLKSIPWALATAS